MPRLYIEGAEEHGAYRVKCSCGATWKGRGTAMSCGTFNPAMPVAESVVHVRLEHPSDRIDLEFSPGFQAWLQRYWEAINRDLEALIGG